MSNIKKSETLIKSADALDIKLRDHGYAILGAEHSYPRSALPMSRLYFCKSGSAVLEYKNTKITALPGYVYLIPANFKFGYIAGNDGWEKLFVHFVVLRHDGYDLFSAVPGICNIYLGTDKIDELIKMYDSDDTQNSFRFKCRVYETVSSIVRENNLCLQDDVSHSALVKSAMDYIRNNLSIKLSVAKIASECFISESLLSKRFKEECGMTIGKYIDDQVFFAAQNMLIDTNLSIARISEMLGFCDQFYFSRKFRRFAGISPRYYRKYRY